MKSKIKLNHYVLYFFLVVILVMTFGDTVKYLNYKKTLKQNFLRKHINETQQIREGYRLIFDKLQYDFNLSESKNISKIDQLFELYKGKQNGFDIHNAAVELNKNVSFGKYQVFLINREYIIEKATYENDIGYNLGQYKVVKNLIDSIFKKEIPLDISPIKIDSSSMHFKRYLLKRSNDGKYLLQVGFVLDIYEELKKKYHSTKGENLLELYLATENVVQKLEFDKTPHTKQSLQESWMNTKSFLSQLVNDLRIKNGHITTLLDSDINDKSIQINKEIDQLFDDGKLLYNLDLSKSHISIYSITNSLFNKSVETKLIVKTVFLTAELEEDIKAMFNQFMFQLVFIIVVFGLIFNWMRLNLKSSYQEIQDRNRSLIKTKTELEKHQNTLEEKNQEIQHYSENLTDLVKQRTKALRESEEKFRFITEESLVGVYIIQDKMFRYVNPRFCEIFRYTSKELVNLLGPEDLTHPDDHSKVRNNIEKRMRREVVSIHYDFRAIQKDGNIRVVEVLGQLAEYQGKEAIIGTLLDITERKAAEEVMLQAKSKSDQANRAKSEFLATIVTSRINLGRLFRPGLGET